MPEQLLIRNNVIRDNPIFRPVNSLSANGSVAIYAGTKYPTTNRLLHGFRIEGNLIINPGMYGIVVRNCSKVIIRGNRIENPCAARMAGMLAEQEVSNQYAAIGLDAVSDASVTENEVVFGATPCKALVWMSGRCDASSVEVQRNHSSGAALPEVWREP